MYYSMRTTYTTPSLSLPLNRSGHKVRAEVVLGSPSANCAGVGICRVMALGENAGLSCPTVPALISITEEGKLRLEFQKSSMEGRFMRRHFRWSLFQVFEPYLVPYHILGHTKLEQRTIRPGIYQVWEVEDTLIVDFG